MIKWRGTQNFRRTPLRPNFRKYALLSYSTSNLGDEIQSLAAQQFLPQTDLMVDRDALNSELQDANGRHKIILNGWYMSRPENWPPSSQLAPLITSFHISREIFRENALRLRPSEVLMNARNAHYLRRHAPIGARDLWTLALLKKANIDAYFSGCLTLTLTVSGTRARKDYICANDLNAALLAALKSRGSLEIVPTTHSEKGPSPFADRFAAARRLLGLYASAKCVVTTRLHCAMPCLALGTPVLLIVNSPDLYRFSGLDRLVRHCSVANFLAGRVDFDFDDPSPNSSAYLPLRKKLIHLTQEYIGTPVHRSIPT